MQEARSSYAIPMPYIPGPAPAPVPTTRQGAEINIDMMTERRSSGDLGAGSLNAGRVQSTAVVKFSSQPGRPAPLARLAEQTNLNLPPDNWLKDEPSSRGFVPQPQLHQGELPIPSM